MQVCCINDIREFDKLKPAWDAAYSSDAHAQIFVSWAWLRGWFETTSNNWFVLAIRPNSRSPYVAFFPLATRSGRLIMGGNPLADYTGFVCSPEYEEEAIAAFAAYVHQELEWDSFDMKDVLDDRLQLFLKHFSSKKFNIQQLDSTICPYIPLSKTWNQYLLTFLGQKHRRNIRRCLGKIEADSGFHVTDMQANNREHQIEALLTLWQTRWGKGCKDTLKSFRAILQSCLESNHLYLPVLWNGTLPVAACVVFVDQQKKCCYAYIAGWDHRFAKVSPGTALHAYCIRYAIENGFQIYDFLRGDESYKYSSFGAINRFNSNILIERKSLWLTARKLGERLHRSLSRTLHHRRGI